MPSFLRISSSQAEPLYAEPWHAEPSHAQPGRALLSKARESSELALKASAFCPAAVVLLVWLMVGSMANIASAQDGARASPPNPIARPATAPAAGGTLDLNPLDGQAPLFGDPVDDTAAAIEAALTPPAGQDDFDLVIPDPDAGGVPVEFSATLIEGGQALDRDLSWTVYAFSNDTVSDDNLVLTSQGGTLRADLAPGSYVVHVSYGMATLARPLTVGAAGHTDVFNLNSGGMSLRGAIAVDEFLPLEDVSFQVFAENEDDLENSTPIVSDVDERTVLVVPAGRYTVVSRYGDANAIVRAQIDVEPGQLTEAVMFHNAAEITLKLVNEPSGEALPNTAWSVLNPGGDVVNESVGAFPTMILSEGDYTMVARYEGQVFSRDFAVITGVNREEELVAQ